MKVTNRETWDRRAPCGRGSHAVISETDELSDSGILKTRMQDPSEHFDQLGLFYVPIFAQGDEPANESNHGS
jgi:hypothetical protein